MTDGFCLVIHIIWSMFQWYVPKLTLYSQYSTTTLKLLGENLEGLNLSTVGKIDRKTVPSASSDKKKSSKTFFPAKNWKLSISFRPGYTIYIQQESLQS